MGTDHLHIGLKGEEMAVRFLMRKGYRIIAKRFKNKIGEIDLIAHDQGVVVFIEVKTRLSLSQGMPQESVTYFKQQKIIRVAQSYLLMVHRSVDVACRFDVISIYLDQVGQVHLEHLDNAFGLN